MYVVRSHSLGYTLVLNGETFSFTMAHVIDGYTAVVEPCHPQDKMNY